MRNPYPPRLQPHEADWPDLSSAGLLQDLDVRSPDWSNSNTQYLELTGCRISDAASSDVNWQGSRWVDTEWIDSDLANAQVVKLQTERVRMSGCRVVGWDVSTAMLTDLIINNTQAQWSNWRSTKIRRAHFNGVDLSHSQWAGADLNQVLFTDCNLNDADFSQVSPTQVVFDHCELDRLTGWTSLAGSSISRYEPVSLLTQLSAVLKLDLD